MVTSESIIGDTQEKEYVLVVAGDGRCDSPGHCAKSRQ